MNAEGLQDILGYRQWRCLRELNKGWLRGPSFEPEELEPPNQCQNHLS